MSFDGNGSIGRIEYYKAEEVYVVTKEIKPDYDEYHPALLTSTESSFSLSEFLSDDQIELIHNLFFPIKKAICYNYKKNDLLDRVVYNPEKEGEDPKSFCISNNSFCPYFVGLGEDRISYICGYKEIDFQERYPFLDNKISFSGSNYKFIPAYKKAVDDYLQKSKNYISNDEFYDNLEASLDEREKNGEFTNSPKSKQEPSSLAKAFMNVEKQEHNKRQKRFEEKVKKSRKVKKLAKKMGLSKTDLRNLRHEAKKKNVSLIKLINQKGQ